MDIPKSLFEKYICRVRTAHQPLKAPEGIKRADSECDRDLEGVLKRQNPVHLSPSEATGT